MFVFLLDIMVLVGQAVSLLALLYGAWLVHGDTFCSLFRLPTAAGCRHEPPRKPIIGVHGSLGRSIQ